DRERLVSVANEAAKRQASFFEVEKEWDLPGHSYLGEVIATKWGLPQVIRLAIRYHHFDVRNMDSILASAKPAIYIVRLANVIVVRNRIGKSGDYSDGAVTADLLEPLGITLEDVKQVEERLQKDMERAGSMLNAYL